MTKAQTARLLVCVLGVAATGLIVSRLDGTALIVGASVIGTLASGICAEAAFRALAGTDEVRRDLEDRVRNSD